MNSKVVKAGPGLLLAVALVALAPSVAPAVLQVGQEAPNFTLPDTAYVNHELTEWRGRCVLLNFWTST
ncbi:redoxin domain-containing protein [candidate division WOR-3 bacterium]|nr:redoxin domain-containing protein [candidate division WOR-3 bacterium]